MTAQGPWGYAGRMRTRPRRGWTQGWIAALAAGTLLGGGCFALDWDYTEGDGGPASCLPGCSEDCDDGEDNDGNGDIDCEDLSCVGQPACIGLCDDDDVDCEDPTCFGHPACREDCKDGVDNDGNGAVDCEDPVCFDRPTCQEDCDDGVDNDVDGAIDCEDVQCFGELQCTEDCDDGVDNDVDGDIDCMDAECLGEPACT